MNLLVQILANRAQRVLRNTDGESNRILGLVISSVAMGRVVGSTSSSNLDGTGETDRCSVVVKAGGAFESMRGLGSSGRRDALAGHQENCVQLTRFSGTVARRFTHTSKWIGAIPLGRFSINALPLKYSVRGSASMYSQGIL